MDRRFAIFDMDGTLLDSMGFWQNLGKEYLGGKGIPCPDGKLWEALLQMTMLQSARWMVEHLPLSDPPERIVADMNRMMAEHYRHDIPLKPGAAELLDRLSQTGVRMCVASATDEGLVRECLSRLGVLERFSFLLSCETLGVGKQRPDIYLEAARRFGCVPAEAAVYEDALYAVRTAKEAGFYVVGVYDETSAEDWTEIRRLSQESLIF